ncbi:hypothetical protein AwWohl_10960 [Gammaproteobacteria bacterium]|nr:hypothetical protein AwWohl_10960 [Gammaproteobacteria bacterium]
MINSSLSVANFFVEKSLETGVELTPMKVIKMVYIAHGWYLANTNEPLINEGVQAWKFGPVIETVYQQFSSFRDSQITRMAQTTVRNADNSFSELTPTLSDDRLRTFLSSVWDAYSKYSGWQLSALTHEKGTPWDETWNKHGQHNARGALIPNDVIKAHYLLKMKNN